MKCIHCGTENPDASKFCNNCGAKLESERDKSLTSSDHQLKQFYENYKSWIIGYAAWVVVNITLLLFGGKYYKEGYNSFIHPKEFFSLLKVKRRIMTSPSFSFMLLHSRFWLMPYTISITSIKRIN